jgi:hypothetical protein
MAAPTFVAAYNSAYNTTTSPKTVSVTTQPGDVLVVYGGTENGTASLDTPTGNGLTYTLEQSIVLDINWGDAHLWTATDNTGGTNWTLSVSRTGATDKQWGFSCLVFRDSSGVGASSKTNVNGTAPSLGLTTTQADSAIVVFNNDWNALDASSRTWRTVNSITPSSGNGLETTYVYSSGFYTVFGAYYNDVGTAGSKTLGLSAPGGQKYSILAVEVKGIAITIPVVVTGVVTDVTSIIASGNGAVVSDGGDTITERGICWSTSPTPTTSSSKATSTGTTGNYSAGLTGLTNNTLYYVRAYAINSIGTSYGSQVTFSTATPLVKTLSDNFNDNSRNTALWNISTDTGTIAETEGQLVITPASNNPGNPYDGYVSVNTYNLTGSEITVQAVQGVAFTTGVEQVLSLYITSANSMSMLYSNNNIGLRLRTANVNNDTFVSRNDTNMRWWRIRELNGFIYWDTSPNGLTWTNRRTAAATFAVTSLTVSLSAGTWQNVASPGVAIFDNVNMFNTTPISWLGA